MEKVWRIEILYPQGSCGYFHSWERGMPLVVFNDELALIYSDVDEAAEDYARLSKMEAIGFRFRPSVEPFHRVEKFPSRSFEIVRGATMLEAAE